ncbi:MAG: hypothetical protein U0Q12_20670 [Vicinamibacterales bacterium]
MGQQVAGELQSRLDAVLMRGESEERFELRDEVCPRNPDNCRDALDGRSVVRDVSQERSRLTQLAEPVVSQQHRRSWV